MKKLILTIATGAAALTLAACNDTEAETDNPAGNVDADVTNTVMVPETNTETKVVEEITESQIVDDVTVTNTVSR